MIIPFIIAPYANTSLIVDLLNHSSALVTSPHFIKASINAAIT